MKTCKEVWTRGRNLRWATTSLNLRKVSLSLIASTSSLSDTSCVDLIEQRLRTVILKFKLLAIQIRARVMDSPRAVGDVRRRTSSWGRATTVPWTRILCTITITHMYTFTSLDGPLTVIHAYVHPWRIEWHLSLILKVIRRSLCNTTKRILLNKLQRKEK